MCGIIAINGKDVGDIDDLSIERMLSCLSKRGPDDRGYDRYNESIIGQTRLSIVDILKGHQPMKDNSRSISIVFNGEIYGYKDLKKDLEDKGHIFSSNSDTEVILKSYIEYDVECLDHLDGMFSFAIWDEDKKRLFVARDRFGKKPFYYSRVNGNFIAASEIKSIMALGVKAEIDPEALDDYLHYLYIPPLKTIYKNVKVLPPAHAAVIKDGQMEIWRYWKLESKEIDVTYEKAKEDIERLFAEAVKKRMVADVEIGTLLSGGVDSTLVTYFAQRYSNRPIKSFSVSYEGTKDELPYALEVSRKVGTEHYFLEIKGDLTEELEKVIEYMDEPHGDSSDFPQHMISELAADKVKVVLSGDGADELFMGYGWYQKHWHLPRWNLYRYLSDPFSTYKKNISVFSKKERDRILKIRVTDDLIEDRVTNGIKNPIQKINAFDLLFYLPGQLLSKVDRTSMMHSLEVRSPFLDTALVQYVYSLPQKFKISKDQNKIILKDLLSGIFPKDFVYRRKQGFSAPLDIWLQNEKLKKYITELLDSKNKMYDYLHKKDVEEIKNQFYAGNKEYGQKLWSLVCLAIWFKKHSN